MEAGTSKITLQMKLDELEAAEINIKVRLSHMGNSFFFFTALVLKNNVSTVLLF